MLTTQRIVNFIVFVLVLYGCTVNGYESKKVLLKQFSQCLNSPDLPIVLSYFRVMQKTKGKYVLDVAFSVKQDMPDDWKLEVNVYKCKDAHTLESCEIYLDKLKNDDGCTVLTQMFEDYASIFNDVHPKMSCPIKVGDYKLEDCSIDSNVINFLSYGSSGSILIRIDGNKDNVSIFCIEVRLDITNRKTDVIIAKAEEE